MINLWAAPLAWWYMQYVIAGSLEVKHPTIWTEEAVVGRVREEKRTKSVAPEAHKVDSLKRRVRRYLGRCGIKNCTPVARSRF
jgi:hypothetical protein